MKKYLISIITICTLASCSKWLDVTPRSEVAKDDLFETEDGFKEALNGLYSRLTVEQMFGRELSVGMLDAMAQNYNVDALDSRGYRQAIQFAYKQQTFMQRRDDIWIGYYNVIANANLILENIDEKKSVFSGVNYDIIKGEALAMRGFCHFDVLRLFADSYATEPEGKGIPYATAFDKDAPAMAKVGEAIDLVLKDLLAAKELLRGKDPILTPGYKVGYPAADTATETDGELFLQVRRHRLNYYAVCGELARVYLYRNDQPNALANALEVINAGKFPWTKQADFLNADDEKKDRILYNELLFGFYAPNATNPIRDVLGNQQGLTLIPSEARTIYEVGGVGADDFRFKQWFQEESGSAGTFLRVMKYNRDPDNNLYDQIVPAIRLSEMYYIAAECTFDTDPGKAWEYFNTVRLYRGIGTQLSDPSKITFMNELAKEYRKEMISEGQLFYFYKRLNSPLTGPSGSSISPSKAIFVVPFPDDEIAYGNR